MKTLSLAVVLTLVGLSTAFSEEFPEVGKSYVVDYAVELVSNPPREFKIISKGSGSWYLIEYEILAPRRVNDPAPAPPPTTLRKWINFDHILLAEER